MNQNHGAAYLLSLCFLLNQFKVGLMSNQKHLLACLYTFPGSLKVSLLCFLDCFDVAGTRASHIGDNLEANHF